MMCVVGGDGEGTHKKQRATNSSAENYKPVYNHSGFEIPPRMLPQTLASLHTHTSIFTQSFLTELHLRTVLCGLVTSTPKHSPSPS